MVRSWKCQRNICSLDRMGELAFRIRIKVTISIEIINFLIQNFYKLDFWTFLQTPCSWCPLDRALQNAKTVIKFCCRDTFEWSDSETIFTQLRNFRSIDQHFRKCVTTKIKIANSTNIRYITKMKLKFEFSPIFWSLTSMLLS